MRALRATVPWLVLALALAAWWPMPQAPSAPAPPLPPPESDKGVALATVALPAPPPLPVAKVAAPAIEPPPAIEPLRPTLPKPAPAPPVVVPLREAPALSKPSVPESTASPPPAAIAAEPAEDGRALLRLLEHGRGPQISIDWPGGADSRRLADLLARCHGMRVALLDGEGRLWREADAAGQPWQANLDRFSGFLRVGAGDAVEADRIRRRHGVAGQPVRLFPRAVDASLLASLRQAVGRGYGAARQIRLRYRLDRGGVVLDAIQVDGRARPGFIRLAGTGGCRA